MESEFLSRGYSCPSLRAELTITTFTYPNSTVGILPWGVANHFYTDDDNIYAKVDYGSLEYGTYSGTLEFTYDGILNASGAAAMKIHTGDVHF